MIKDINKIEEYLAELERIKNDVNIYITVGDQFFHGEIIKQAKTIKIT
jgi:chaperonin cofactor prefoldin